MFGLGLNPVYHYVFRELLKIASDFNFKGRPWVPLIHRIRWRSINGQHPAGVVGCVKRFYTCLLKY